MCILGTNIILYTNYNKKIKENKNKNSTLETK